MSSPNESEAQPLAASPPDADPLSVGGGAEPVADALARLEGQLQRELDARKEERFIWIVIATALVDVILVGRSENAALPLILIVLELIVLVVLAKKMGIEDVVALLDRLLHNVGRSGGG